MSENPTFSLAEWPSYVWKTCTLIGSIACVFVVSGNPAFSLGEQSFSPKGGSIYVVRCILIG